jgi:molecular chaperone IbpA
MGIATRAFERRFELADFVRVENAELRDGLLSIELVREIPDAMKPRKVEINGGSSQTIEASNDGQEQIGSETQRQTEAA